VIRARVLALALSLALAPALALAQEEAPIPAPAEIAPPTPPPAPDLTTLPTGHGLPVLVHVAVYVVDLIGIDENEEAFDATIDLRLTWSDPRLAVGPTDPTRRFDDSEIDAELETIWSPTVRLANIDGEPAHRERGLRIAPSGNVELLERTTARFHAAFDVTRFPFDRQALSVEVLSTGLPHELVSLVFRQPDLDFTRLGDDIEAAGWTPLSVVLHRERVPGWHGEVHDRVRATLTVARDATHTAAPIFIPLLASLLIPLLAMWLNKYEEGEFKIEAFELANVIVGGLFAIIALNFTVSSELSALGVGDNTVSRLFALNYVTLATSLLVNLLLFRYRLVGRAFGRFVEEQAFHFLTWALPLAAVSTAIACVLAAYA